MIPFNQASFDGNELAYLERAIRQGHTAGNGPFTKQAEAMLAEMHDGSATLLTTSCTHALEMAALLLDLQPGDEVIVPSFTFISTANAFAHNGVKLVFADVRQDTLNIDPDSVNSLITDRTRAICIVHYAGVGADPYLFADLCEQHGLTLIEDNAHGLGAQHQGKTLGTFGAMSTLSFHETKNVTCGEGGALVLNDRSLLERAEILREKGTNRSNFLRGQVDRYTWVDTGSSWVMSDLLAGVLVGQLERFDEIQRRRRSLWDRYHDELYDWAEWSGVIRPNVPIEAAHSAHAYHLRLPSPLTRDRLIQHLRAHNILAVFHYQPLHSSPRGLVAAGGRAACPISEAESQRLVRLPLYASLSDADQTKIIQALRTFQTSDAKP